MNCGPRFSENEIPGSRVRLKVCCISSVREAETAITHGADAIGLVSTMPSGPGVIADGEIERIAAKIPPGVSTFLLTSSRDVEEIVGQQKRFGVDTLQLCDELKSGSIPDLKSRLPGISIVQVVHVTDESSIDQACRAGEAAHALLLDSGDPTKTDKELGGTGRTHNWRISRRICETVNVPVFLAGGLTPENVEKAIEQVMPFGVDVCTGLRTDGCLDEEKLIRFTKKLRLDAGG